MKVKFQSKTYLTNYVEETEDGQLIEHQKFVIDNGEIEAEVLETRKHTVKLKLPDGKIIVKKHHQVELM